MTHTRTLQTLLVWRTSLRGQPWHRCDITCNPRYKLSDRHQNYTLLRPAMCSLIFLRHTFWHHSVFSRTVRAPAVNHSLVTFYHGKCVVIICTSTRSLAGWDAHTPMHETVPHTYILIICAFNTCEGCNFPALQPASVIIHRNNQHRWPKMLRIN